jgi:hypothetical protein
MICLVPDWDGKSVRYSFNEVDRVAANDDPKSLDTPCSLLTSNGRMTSLP